jgi:hypothetical protein
MDKAKGLIEEHRGQVEQGLHKATDKFNKLAGGQASSGTSTATEPETNPAGDATDPEAQNSVAEAAPVEAAEATGAPEEGPDAG